MSKFLRLPCFVLFSLLLTGCEIILEEEVYIVPETMSGIALSVSPETVRFNLVKFADEYGVPIGLQGFDGRYQKSYRFPMRQASGFDYSMSVHYMEPGYYAIADIRNYRGGAFYSSELTPVEFDSNRFLPKWGAVYVPRGYIAYIGHLDFNTYTGRLEITQRYDQRAIRQYVQLINPSLAARVITGGYYPSGYFYRF